MANCNYKVNLTDIQNKYKFKIFNTGSYNDSDLRKMIESVFYALPRTTGEGTSVTLTDTAFSYMKNKLYATDTSQNTTTGKNLLPTLNATQSYKQTTISCSNGIFHDTTSRTGTTEYACTFTFTNNIGYGNYGSYVTPTGNIIELEAGTYTFSYKKISGTAPTYDEGSKARTLSVYQYKDTQPYTSIGSTRILGDTASFTFTLTEKTKITLCYGYYFYTDISSNVYFTLQLESGSSASEWEEYTGGQPAPNPDYPQVIHTITGDNEVVVCGKNLFDKSTSETKKFINKNTGNVDNSNNWSASDFIPIEQNSNYIYSGITNGWSGSAGTCFYDSNKTFISSISSTTQSFTTPNNAKYVRISLNTETPTQVQLEKGSTSSQYESYQSNSVLLTLGDKEVCKIGDYEDKIFKAIKGNEIYDSLASEEKATLDYGKWYLRKAIGKVVLIGSGNTELWGNGGTATNYWEYQRSGLVGGTGTMADVKTNYFNQTDNSRVVILGNGGLYLRFPKASGIDASTSALMNTWLSTHNTIVCYVLATPTNELFNDTIQEQLEDIYNNMLSYEGTTNILQENADLPFNIEATAIKDLNSL